MAYDKAKILLIDDEPFNTDILSIALANYQVRVAHGGEDGVQLAAEFMPDLVLLDIGLPDIDGYEVCKRLKDDPGLREIQIIFLTAMTGQAVVSRCFKAGAVDYIAKPFGIPEVQSRVQTHIGLKRAHDALNAQNARLAETVREQQLNIGLARQLLRLINRDAPRHFKLSDQAALFVQTMVWPCHQEGGDHLQVKAVPGKTLFSLKDQSGHAVGCVLRSIATDLLHNALLAQEAELPLAAMVGRLNRDLCRSGFFRGDEFCTAILAELDHRTLRLEVLTAGHPPLLLIRDRQVMAVPGPLASRHNLPLAFLEDAAFQGSTCQLEVGDRLLIYSDGLHQFGLASDQSPRTHQELMDILSALLAERPDLDLARLLPAFLGTLDSGFAGSDLGRSNPSGDDLSLIGMEIESMDGWRCLSLRPADFPTIDQLIGSALAALWPEIEAAQLVCSEEDVRLAVSEVILNAWRHGNQREPQKEIHLTWKLVNDFCVAVSDEGEGFDPSQLPDPTESFRLVSSHGRGLFMVRRVVDWLEWRLGGRQVVMAWRRLGTLPPGPGQGRQRGMMQVVNLWPTREGGRRVDINHGVKEERNGYQGS